MFRAVALVPSPPLLVPELTGGGASEAGPVRDAALAAAAHLGGLASRWVAVGVGDGTATVGPGAQGSFGGYGVEVSVGLSPGAADVDDRMPLAALVAAWLRARAAPDAVVEAYLVGVDDDAGVCRRLGRDLRARMDAGDEDWGVLVVADGATTLTAKAPGSFDDRAPDFQKRIDDALAAADLAEMHDLDRGLCRDLGVTGFSAWQVLTGLVGDDAVTARTLYRGAPFGVGYYVGLWEPSA